MRMGGEPFRAADASEDEAAPGIAAIAFPMVRTARAVRMIKFFTVVLRRLERRHSVRGTLKTGFGCLSCAGILRNAVNKPLKRQLGWRHSGLVRLKAS
jgi:hypothetical protein